MRYCGYFFDAQTALYNVRWRIYHPTLSTWLTRDPIGYAAGDQNVYRYVRNKATSRIDPFGLQVPIDLPDATRNTIVGMDATGRLVPAPAPPPPRPGWRFVPGLGTLVGRLGRESRKRTKGHLGALFTLTFKNDIEAFQQRAKGTCCAEIRFIQIAYVSLNQRSLGRGWPLGQFRTPLDQWFVDSPTPPYYPEAGGDPRKYSWPSMSDNPEVLHFTSLIDDFSFTFETCAVCSESQIAGSSAGVGDVFGCVTWSYSGGIFGARFPGLRELGHWYLSLSDVRWHSGTITTVMGMGDEGPEEFRLGHEGLPGENAGSTYHFEVAGKAPSDTMARFLDDIFN